MMRILLLNQYFHPDIAATAQLAADLGANLADRGHEVWAVASARAYSGGGWRALGERHHGVRIVRVPATAFGRGSNALRALDYATFVGAVLPTLAALPRPDVVIALSTPPLIAALGLLCKRLRGSRLVYWVMDVYPEVAVALGAMAADSVATRLSAALQHALLHGADAVVALDHTMRERLIATGAPPDRVEVIDNWAPSLDDAHEIAPAPRDHSTLRQTLGLGDRFTIAYSGNMGRGHDFDTLLEAMALLRDLDVHWLFIGDGPRRAELEQRAAAIGLAHLTFTGYRERAQLEDSLTSADAHLVCLNHDLAGLLAPSKLYGILAAGVPVIYVGPPAGRTAEAVRDGAGVEARNGDPAGLARAIRLLFDQPTYRATLGRQARALFEKRYTRAAALERHHDLLTRVSAC